MTPAPFQEPRSPPRVAQHSLPLYTPCMQSPGLEVMMSTPRPCMQQHSNDLSRHYGPVRDMKQKESGSGRSRCHAARLGDRSGEEAGISCKLPPLLKCSSRSAQQCTFESPVTRCERTQLKSTGRGTFHTRQPPYVERHDRFDVTQICKLRSSPSGPRHPGHSSIPDASSAL